MLGAPVFREDRAMVENAIRSFMDPLVDVIIIDNGSTDEAKAGIATFEDHIDVVCNPENIYVNPAWNQIAERFLASQAEVLVVANSDLIAKPGWAETLFSRHRESRAREFWFGRRTGDQREVEVEAPRSHTTRESGAPNTRGGFFALTRAAVQLVFPLPAPPLIWYGDDWIFNILLRVGFRAVTLEDVVVWHAESVSQKRLPDLNSIVGQDRQQWDLHLGHRAQREADDIVRRGKGLDEIEARYLAYRDTPSDFNEHMPILRAYAERVNRVTEFGVGRSSWALLHARPKVLRCYDIGDDIRRVGMSDLIELGTSIGVDASFTIGSSLTATIEPTDLLFIDTLHTYVQLWRELDRHASKVANYIILHDTETFGAKGEDGSQPGLVRAVDDFLAQDHEWRVRDRLKNNNGLTILERR